MASPELSTNHPRKGEPRTRPQTAAERRDPGVTLTPKLIRSFVSLFLLHRFDNPLPSPDFHDEMWALACDPHPKVVMAAPRGTAKSSSITHAFTLASVLFRLNDYVILISDTEGQAAEFLGDIKTELLENEDIRAEFDILKFSKDSETDLIVRCKDGHVFRIVAKGSEQKIRGRKWRNKRPNLIICDDIENDESVMNPERRKKFSSWFRRAVVQSGGDFCKVRVMGTVLHDGSMLNKLLKNRAWKSLKFRVANVEVHESGPVFSNLLWPEKYDQKRLEDIWLDFADARDLPGFYQEYMNEPTAEGETYFRKEDFIVMSPQDHESKKVYFAAADFAISEKEVADRTVIMVAGMDSHGIIHIEDVRHGHWGSKKIIEELISVQERYAPEIFTFETEKIDKAFGPYLNDEMHRTGHYLHINKITPTKSKTTRGKSTQAIMESGGFRFNDIPAWFEMMKAEVMMMTPGGNRGEHDDFFDAFAYIGLTVDKYRSAATDEECEDEIYEDEMLEADLDVGRCGVGGY